MPKVVEILELAGWKKAPDFTPQQMQSIKSMPLDNKPSGFIACPFGFGGDKEKNNQDNNSASRSGLKPFCPVHGDNCPGLRRYRK